MRTAWRRQDLARQFLLVSTIVILISMALLGRWISARIEASVTQNAAVSAALYAESFIAPLVQSLAEDSTYRPEVQTNLEKLLRETPLGKRIVALKVWANGGLVRYSSKTDDIGHVFQPTPNLRRAWTGQVAAEFDDLNDEEDAEIRTLNIPLLEVYVPIRKSLSENVIAVAEFYAEARQLKSDIFQANLESWLILGTAGIFAVATLFGMVSRANRTILDQRRSLQSRIAELSDLLGQNTELRRHVERSSQRASEVNERYLRRLGSELHDGPAQLLSLALLRLDASRKAQSSALSGASGGQLAQISADERDTQIIRSALSDALKEIRNISVGLSLPELENLSLEGTLRSAVRAHEQRSGVRIELALGNLPQHTGQGVKSTAYRFVQEGLNNAYRHAQGAGIKVSGTMDSTTLVLAVEDIGPGFDPSALGQSARLGLIGLKERLEASGGSLDIAAAPGTGTRLTARLPIDAGDAHHD